MSTGSPAADPTTYHCSSGDPAIPMKVGYDDTNQLLPEPLTPWHGALDEVMLYHRALDARADPGFGRRKE
jgi:hypothetical protein